MLLPGQLSDVMKGHVIVGWGVEKKRHRHERITASASVFIAFMMKGKDAMG